MEYKVIKKVNYKNHTINKVIDRYGQTFATIDNDKKLYDSIADAKRVINGLQPIYEIQ